jgi:hypothetical protein
MFAANAVHLQLHALADNLGNFLHTLTTPKPIKGLVAHRPQGEAHQDRRESAPPPALRQRLGAQAAAGGWVHPCRKSSNGPS